MYPLETIGTYTLNLIVIIGITDISTLGVSAGYFKKMILVTKWFTDEYLGIEIEQYIGFGLLTIIITVVHFALLRLLTCSSTSIRR